MLGPRDFSFRRLLLIGWLSYDGEDMWFSEEPQCLHFGPGCKGNFHIAKVAVQTALGYEKEELPDAQLPLPPFPENPETCV